MTEYECSFRKEKSLPFNQQKSVQTVFATTPLTANDFFFGESTVANHTFCIFTETPEKVIEIKHY